MTSILFYSEKKKRKIKKNTKLDLFYLLGFIGFISIFVYFFLLLSNGTKIIVLPEEARLNAKVKSKNFLDF